VAFTTESDNPRDNPIVIFRRQQQQQHSNTRMNINSSILHTLQRKT